MRYLSLCLLALEKMIIENTTILQRAISFHLTVWLGSSTGNFRIFVISKPEYLTVESFFGS